MRGLFHFWTPNHMTIDTIDTIDALEAAFLAALDTQAADRGRSITAFDRSVAATILDAGRQAMQDRASDHAMYRVVSAPTGSGKSSFAFGLITALVETQPDASAVFLCQTIDQCEETYRELVKLIGTARLAIWTGAHDRSRTDDWTIANYGFVPLARFSKDDLDAYPVIIATHALYKGVDGAKAQTFLGSPRTLTIIDERPDEVALFDIDQGDVRKVRDWMMRKYGEKSAAFIAVTDLDAYLEAVWNAPRAGMGSYKALKLSSQSWFNSVEADFLGRDEEVEEVVRNVIGFARALATGYAFMSRFDSPKGGCFVGYRLAMPVVPGTVLLDATSDIDGVTPLVSWRSQVPSPKVSFDNLTVTLLAPPRLGKGRGRNIKDITRSAKTAEPYAAWIKETVIARTEPGELVLVIAHKAMFDHRYLPDNDSLSDDAVVWEGRKVAFSHWGTGIGSNRWKHATSVFLFGEFYAPRRVFVGQYHGLVDQPASTSALASIRGPRTNHEHFRALEEGHLLRWMKQLAMRGNARNVSAEGVCGRQKLFITTDFDRFLRHRANLFPGAELVIDPSVMGGETKARGAEAIAALLLTTDDDQLTSIQVMERTGVDLGKHGVRLMASPALQVAMRDAGWSLNPGRGRGKPSTFVRLG